jgi:threonine synthase
MSTFFKNDLPSRRSFMHSFCGGCMKHFLYYECVDCGHTFSSNDVVYLCPHCGCFSPPPRGLLLVRYELPAGISMDALSVADWLPLLPLGSAGSLPPVRVGRTPLYHRTVDGCEGGLKNDSQNPTFSYKDRASAVVSAFAKERGLPVLVAASTGNAGSSLAGICAAQGQRAVIMVPRTRPRPSHADCRLRRHAGAGARLLRRRIRAEPERHRGWGWYNRNTAVNRSRWRARRPPPSRLPRPWARRTTCLCPAATA